MYTTQDAGLAAERKDALLEAFFRTMEDASEQARALRVVKRAPRVVKSSLRERRVRLSPLLREDASEQARASRCKA